MNNKDYLSINFKSIRIKFKKAFLGKILDLKRKFYERGKEKEMMEWLKVGQSFGEENKGDSGSKRRNVANYMGKILMNRRKSSLMWKRGKERRISLMRILLRQKREMGKGKGGRAYKRYFGLYNISLIFKFVFRK